MTRLRFTLPIVLVLFLAACTPLASGTPSESTAAVQTVEPQFSTPLSPDFTPPPPPTPTPVLTLAGGLGLTELKYLVLDKFPDFFFCDPDYYPIARADENELAVQIFPELQANSEEFKAILAHNNLPGETKFTEAQKLLVYRDHKKLAAMLFVLTGDTYQFQIQVSKMEGEGELVTGQIDGQGLITVLEKTNTLASCPICLAAGTRIDTPTGSLPVENLKPGMLVWTVDASGKRITRPLILVGNTLTPAGHKVIHLILDDGRELWVSPGHPTTDRRTTGELEVGDRLSGGLIVLAETVSYAGLATYDLLPGGETGFYWANGILLASTLSESAR